MHVIEGTPCWVLLTNDFDFLQIKFHLVAHLCIHQQKLEYAFFSTLTTLQTRKGYPVYGLFTMVPMEYIIHVLNLGISLNCSDTLQVIMTIKY